MLCLDIGADFFGGQGISIIIGVSIVVNVLSLSCISAELLNSFKELRLVNLGVVEDSVDNIILLGIAKSNVVGGKEFWEASDKLGGVHQTVFIFVTMIQDISSSGAIGGFGTSSESNGSSGGEGEQESHFQEVLNFIILRSVSP